MTARFKYLLRKQADKAGQPLTQDAWAAALGMGRARLCQALGNVEGRGGVLRPKITAYIVNNFGVDAKEMLKELGWDQSGNLVPHGMFHQPLAWRPLGGIGIPVTTCGKPFKALQ